jgi:uncharacterized protein (DUF2062 family)
MPFRRKKPAGFVERLRALVWPRKGFKRSFRYLALRLSRLSASPHSVAAGFAIGVAVAWTPFLGVHILLALAIGFVLRVSLVAAALGTAIANPLTLPFIWASTWEIGHLLLGRQSAATVDHLNFESLLHHMDFRQIWRPVLEPMVVGSAVPALICATIAYFGVLVLMRAMRRQRLQVMPQTVSLPRNDTGISA